MVDVYAKDTGRIVHVFELSRDKTLSLLVCTETRLFLLAEDVPPPPLAEAASGGGGSEPGGADGKRRTCSIIQIMRNAEGG